jgi:hypothetical protein
MHRIARRYMDHNRDMRVGIALERCTRINGLTIRVPSWRGNLFLLGVP